MKGVVFTFFEEFVIEKWGEDFFDEVLDACTLKTTEPFVGPGTYPDEDLIEIVSRTVELADVPLPHALEAFGERLFGQLAGAFPKFVEAHRHPKPFLLSVHDIIHVEVRKLWPDAETPSFHYLDTHPNLLTIDYDSKRQLCRVMGGLLNGVAEHFSTPIAWQETQCTHNGDARCRFELDFGEPARG